MYSYYGKKRFYVKLGLFRDELLQGTIVLVSFGFMSSGFDLNAIVYQGSKY